MVRCDLVPGRKTLRGRLDRRPFPVAPNDGARPGVGIGTVRRSDVCIERFDRALSLGRVRPVGKDVDEGVALEGAFVPAGRFGALLARPMKIALPQASVVGLTIGSSPIMTRRNQTVV